MRKEALEVHRHLAEELEIKVKLLFLDLFRILLFIVFVFWQLQQAEKVIGSAPIPPVVALILHSVKNAIDARFLKRAIMTGSVQILLVATLMCHHVRNVSAANCLKDLAIMEVIYIFIFKHFILQILLKYLFKIFKTGKKLGSSFGGGDQSRVNRSLGGFYVNPEEAGSIPRMDGKIIVEPIEEGLELFVTFKKVPSLDYMKTKFEGFHSRSTVKKNSNITSQIILFSSIESLESAKAKLEKDEHVESVDFVGINSSKNQQVCTTLY